VSSRCLTWCKVQGVRRRVDVVRASRERGGPGAGWAWLGWRGRPVGNNGTKITAPGSFGTVSRADVRSRSARESVSHAASSETIAGAQKGQRSPGRRALPERPAMRHWHLNYEPLLWMLVWRDAGEEQLGTGGILAVRTGPMGVPLVAPSPGISAGRCYGTPPTPRLANPPQSRKDARKRFPLRSPGELGREHPAGWAACRRLRILGAVTESRALGAVFRTSPSRCGGERSGGRGGP